MAQPEASDPLALQLRFPLQVGASCGGLVGASPERPGDDAGGPDASLGEADSDAAELLDRPADEARRGRASRIGIFGGAAVFACWRMTASTAKASMTSETWRCQPCQLRGSLWARPSSVFAGSKASSIAPRGPPTLAQGSIAG